MNDKWNGKKVLVLGAARQGLAMAQFLVRHGADVTLNDSKPFDRLTDAYASVKDFPLHWVTSSHPLTLLDAVDVVCVSGGADLRIPILRSALERKISILHDAQIFLETVPARVIGITGSSGKTTTTTLLGRIADAAKNRNNVWVGGNIGKPLMSFADDVQSDDCVILEFSSFQLELMTRSPQIAAIINITPNHLDRHETMKAYTAAKMNILTFQNATDIAVLSSDDAGAWELRSAVQGRLITFGFCRPSGTSEHVGFADGWVKLYDSSGVTNLVPERIIQLRGLHNLSNVMAACALSVAAGFAPEAMCAGIAGFGGVEHRLEWVRIFRGANWYNDSIATAPERSLAGVNSFDEPLIVLLGGQDKKLPWDVLCTRLHECARLVILFGQAGTMIAEVMKTCASETHVCEIIVCESLQDAVLMAAERCRCGDVVLLSPGGTSFDAFHDFAERGEQYKRWVLQLDPTD